MTGKTTIEWTDQPGYRGAVWNPTTGCTRVSAGCDNCYAFALHDKRYAGNLAVAKGYGFTNPVAARRSLEGGAVAGFTLVWPKQYDLPFSRVQLLEDRLDAPLRTRTPTCYFVDSMADLFHDDVPTEFIQEVWVRMWEASQHRFLILTKRPERMRRFVETAMTHLVPSMPDSPTGISTLVAPRPLPNVWLGTSVEDQRSADERIPHLLATPAAVRFLSCEPLLGPVELRPDTFGGYPESDEWTRQIARGHVSPIQWVIVGGESGPRARPMDLAWTRSLVAQCRAAGVAPFVKQMGSKPVETDHWDGEDPGDSTAELKFRESHGRDMAEWPDDLRVREFPGVAVLA